MFSVFSLGICPAGRLITAEFRVVGKENRQNRRVVSG
jgi:hypothetical protein